LNNPNDPEDINRFARELGEKSNITEYKKLIRERPIPPGIPNFNLRNPNAGLEITCPSNKAAVAI
jgi:hypothetical protein